MIPPAAGAGRTQWVPWIAAAAAAVSFAASFLVRLGTTS
ncbi:hypothetical protein QBC98_007057 [Kitasatospora acidiphila]